MNLNLAFKIIISFDDVIYSLSLSPKHKLYCNRQIEIFAC